MSKIHFLSRFDAFQVSVNTIAVIALAVLTLQPLGATLASASRGQADLVHLSLGNIAKVDGLVHPPAVTRYHRQWTFAVQLLFVLYASTPCAIWERSLCYQLLQKTRAVCQFGLAVCFALVPFEIQQFKDHGVSTGCTLAWYISLALILLMLDTWVWRHHHNIGGPLPQPISKHGHPKNDTSLASTHASPESTLRPHLVSGRTASKHSRTDLNRPSRSTLPHGIL